MDKFTDISNSHPIATFLGLTFILSFLAFCAMWLNPKFQTPENMNALPIWLIAVWSPTLSAGIIWLAKGELFNHLSRLLSLPSPSIWQLLLLIPIVTLLCVNLFHPSANELTPSNINTKTIVLLLLINLVLGPLGEEAGWRGFLFPIIQEKTGWMGAALIIGAVWSLWHLPLWSINSPQAEISMLVFIGHVFSYSILMSILFMTSKGSIISVILFHLLVNVVSGYASLINSHSISEFYRISLYYYASFALIAAGLYELFTNKTCNLT